MFILPLIIICPIHLSVSTLLPHTEIWRIYFFSLIQVDQSIFTYLYVCFLFLTLLLLVCVIILWTINPFGGFFLLLCSYYLIFIQFIFFFLINSLDCLHFISFLNLILFLPVNYLILAQIWAKFDGLFCFTNLNLYSNWTTFPYRCVYTFLPHICVLFVFAFALQFQFSFSGKIDYNEEVDTTLSYVYYDHRRVSCV